MLVVWLLFLKRYWKILFIVAAMLTVAVYLWKVWGSFDAGNLIIGLFTGALLLLVIYFFVLMVFGGVYAILWVVNKIEEKCKILLHRIRQLRARKNEVSV